MEFQCFVCSKRFSSVANMTRHLSIDHALLPGSKLKLKCCHPPCSLSFNTYSGLRKHLVKHLQDKDAIKECTLPSSIAQSSENSSQSQSRENILSSDSDCSRSDAEQIQYLSDTSSSECEAVSDLPATTDSLATNYLLKLDATEIPKSSLRDIIEGSNELINNVIDNVLNFLSETDSNKDLALKQYLHKQKNLFKGIDTNYKVGKFYSGLKDFVKPVEVAIGTRFDQIFDSSLNTYKTIAVPCTFMYIPILETLNFLLRNKSVRSMIFRKSHEKTDILSDICDGSYYAAHPLFSQPNNALQLQLFYDDFETANPLGSKTIIHKLGAIYFILRNLPPHVNSQLQNIHLVALFYVSDSRIFGFDQIMKPIIKDIKTLESEGLVVGKRKVQGSIIALSFDSLGGNTLLGLVESFSATHFCRLCTATKQETRVMITEDETLLRSNDTYDEICAKLNSATKHVLGIKTESILNDLRYFKIFNSLSADIMHDILEGVGQYEIKLFVTFIVNDLKIISLSDLNERIKSFNYGVIDMRNKPSSIALDKPGVLIGQRAAQTWCLIRYLPLILGDIVHPSHEQYSLLKSKWRVITLLLSCMSIIFAPQISIGMIEQLRWLIHEHHSQFKSAFNTHLLPKHHFMVHYPRIIKSMGPLIHLWAMRFEGKHNYFKDLASKYHNFKNISKTLANQHQRYIYYHWRVCHKDLEVEISTGPGKFDTYGNLVSEFALDSTEAMLKSSDKVLIVNRVETGLLYKAGFFVVTRIDDGTDLPIFKEILKIFIHSNTPFAICSEWDTKYFSDEYHAFAVQPKTTNHYSIINLNILKHKPAYECHQSFSHTAMFIVPKYHIL